MRGGQGLLVVGQQFLVELLAGAQAGEGDRDLGLGVARKLDHGPRQVDDADRLAHVEHEGFAATTHQARLQHQLGGLGDRHEVAGDVGMGDGQWPAIGDLFAKLGDDAAAGAQHVAEAHHHHRQRGHAVQVLQDHFGQPLGGPHHVGGIDRLVTGDVDETIDLETRGDLGQHAGAIGVVAHRLPGVAFFQDRHVLVGGGVVDDVGLVALEGFLQTDALLDVAQHRHDAQRRVGLLQVFAGPVERVFAQLVDDDLGWLETGDLATQFRADRAATAGDQHRLALQHVAQAAGVEADGVAAEQVVHLDITDLRYLDLAAHQLLHVRNDQQLDVGALAQLEDAAAGGVVGGSHGQHRMLAVAVAGDGFELFPAAEDAHPAQLAADLVGVVVQHADHVPVGVAVQLVDQRQRGGAGAQQHHRLRLDPLLAHRLFLPPAVDQPARAHEQDQQQRVEEVERARHAQPVAPQQQQDRDDERRGADRHRDQPHVVDRGVAPDAAVQAEIDETADLHGQHGRQRLEQQDLGRAIQVEVPAQREGEAPHQRRHDDVVADGDEGSWIDVEQSHDRQAGSSRPAPRRQASSSSGRKAMAAVRAA